MPGMLRKGTDSMLDGIYDITLKSQMGPRTGLLSITCQQDGLQGKLQLLGFENSFSEGASDGDHFFIRMDIDTLLGPRPIVVEGICAEDILTGMVEMALQQFPFTAKRKGLQTAPSLF